MKKTIYLYIILFVVKSYSQNSGSISLNWSLNSKVTYNTFDINVPKFDNSGYNFDLNKKQILLTLKKSVNATIDEKTLRIDNVIYETINQNELGQLDLNKIPTNLNPKITNFQGRDEKFVQFSISPIIKNGGVYQKVMSFNYSFIPDRENVKRSNNTTTIVANSVLATGDWYRFYVKKSGVYRLSKNFLDQLGFNTSGIDPKKIKIYGNGGRMLPMLNSVSYPSDLQENAIQIIGENDGVLNDEDSILFYAEGVDNWNDESETSVNLYEEKSYYYITAQADNGKRIQLMNQPSGLSNLTISTFNDKIIHEVDLTNIGRLGRQWYGEKFDYINEQSFDFSIPNIVSTSSINSNFHFAAVSTNSSSFDIKANNTLLNTVSIGALGIGASFNENYSSPSIAASENLNIKITYNNNGVPTAVGYLDYIILNTIRNLKGYGQQFRFQYNNANSLTGIGTFELSNASSINQIWDITDIYNVTKLENNNAATISYKSNLGEIRKFVAIDYNDLYNPSKDNYTRVVNQNLKGTIFNNKQGQFQDIDYLIITPSFLNSQAETLANFHRNYSNLNVKVVNLESIYPEFSSGKQDIGGIRNFVKYVYQNASSPDKKVKFLNLFGDASFDFKNRIPNNTNIVPIYHALTSNSLGEASFASDDFFGLMDDNEGSVEVFYGGLDIAVGRMIVSSNQQASEMVNKVIEYHDIKSYGSWRNNCVYLADDADKISDLSLQVKQNNLSDTVATQKPFINTEKIFLDAYVQESSAGGFRYPKAREDVFNAFQKGALVFNYLGHGGEDGLTQERVWEKVDGQNLTNQYRYPLFITITCDFSRFDNPYRPTAGEYTYWNPKGGAISMITTIREIGQGSAETFNDTLSSKLFAYNSNTYPTIAEALRIAKNTSQLTATNVVFYLGDPALMLAIPKPKIVLTKVNDMPITGPIDDFKSLAYVKLTGEILDENNLNLNTYNGDLAVQIFDKTIPRTTLNNDYQGSTMAFNTLGETIFRGNASVNNGKFEFGFVVPRDIRIPLGNGRISFYGKRNQLLLDKTGYNTTIKIGGVNVNAAADTTPPKVRLYMNDESFVNGGITNESPIFLAFLEDENGINTASGIGHDILAYLDGNETNPYLMNDYYDTELNNYKKGIVKYPFRNLSKGLHTLTFKAWDVYNNLVTAQLQFVVVGDETITLTNVLNYPNPFVNYTQFWFTHNRPFEPLEVQIQVMTITGKVVWTRNQIITTEGFLSRELTWDGKDDFGDKIGKGVYVYKLTVKSTITNSKAEKYEKLVIL